MEPLIKCHCFLLHIHSYEWNVLRTKYFCIFTCKTGTLLFSPLVWPSSKVVGRYFLAWKQRRQVFPSLLCLPGQPHLHDFPEVPYQQPLLQFHLAVNSLLLFRECSPGSGGCSEEMRTCLCPIPPWPWGPHCWLPGCCQSKRQVVAASTAALCSQKTPFCWDSWVNVLPTLLLRTKFFHNALSPPVFKINNNNLKILLCVWNIMDVAVWAGCSNNICPPQSVFLFCLSSARVAHEDISSDGAGDTALKTVTFCVSGSYIEGTCQRRASSAN